MNQYKKAYNQVKKFKKPEFSSSYWNKKCDIISREFNKDLPANFLQNSNIKETMVAGNEMKAVQQLGYIKGYWREQADLLLEEPANGGLNKPLNTEKHSCNIINHVNFATKFVEHSEQSETPPLVFLETGGGFGTLAMVFNKIYPDCTYVIVDVPAVIALQKSYLGDLATVVDGDTNPDLKSGKIYLVPIGLLTEDYWLDHIEILGVDVFIAMWSIGEVMPEMNDFLLERIGDTECFMIGTHNWKCGNFTQAARVYKHFSDRCSYHEEVGPNNHLMIK